MFIFFLDFLIFFFPNFFCCLFIDNRNKGINEFIKSSFDFNDKMKDYYDRLLAVLNGNNLKAAKSLIDEISGNKKVTKAVFQLLEKLCIKFNYGQSGIKKLTVLDFMFGNNFNEFKADLKKNEEAALSKFNASKVFIGVGETTLLKV